jgi:type IV secretion system protein VirB4
LQIKTNALLKSLEPILKMFFRFSLPGKDSNTIANREIQTSAFLPYLCHYNNSTILTNDLDMVSVIKVEGFSFETADDEDVDGKKTSRNNVLKGISSTKYAVWSHTVRRKNSSFPDGDFDNRFCEILNKQWRAKHSPDHTFINEHYITIVRKGGGAAQKVSSLLGKISGADKDDKLQKQLKEAYMDMQEVRDRLVSGLSVYRPEVLEVVETKDGNFCKILEFLSYILNIGNQSKMLVPSMKISQYLANSRLYFGSNYIEAHSGGVVKYAAMISLKEYRSATFAGVMDGFLQMPCEFVIAQSFQFSDRMASISKMQLQQRRLVQSEDVAVSQVHEINQALDSAMSGEFGFGEHHISVMVIADSQKELDSYSSEAVVGFANFGATAVRERTNMQATFWAQFAANFGYIVRKSTINTLNLSAFMSLHNYPAGKTRDNFWGPALSVFNTTSGTSYFFSFHVRDVGHTMIIGPTGAGKTVLLNFLAAQAQKFKPRTFFFDKDRGAEIFIRAIRGNYLVIDPARTSGFNPFQLEDIPSNRSFLVDWLVALAAPDGIALSPEDMSLLTTAVDGAYKLPKEKRKLANVAAFLGVEKPGSLASKVKMWHSGGSRSKIFDNDADLIDFKSARSFGFEMAELLKDKISMAPALLYLFHRINMSLDGTRTMVVLDEAWALIDNPIFAPRIKDWLKVMRKLNAFVVFATQSVEDAAKSQISDTLVQQTATQIYLPNLKATPVYKSVFMLSDREYLLVKTTDPGSRFFLIKQDGGGVIARIDLRGMTDVVNILSARADTVRLLDTIIADVGPDPDKWMEIFWKKVREI